MKCEAVTCRHCKLTELSISYGYCQLEDPKINEESTKCLSYQEREYQEPNKK